MARKKDYSWFTERIGKTIQSKIYGVASPLEIKNEEHAGLLFNAQDSTDYYDEGEQTDDELTPAVEKLEAPALLRPQGRIQEILKEAKLTGGPSAYRRLVEDVHDYTGAILNELNKREDFQEDR